MHLHLVAIDSRLKGGIADTNAIVVERMMLKGGVSNTNNIITLLIIYEKSPRKKSPRGSCGTFIQEFVRQSKKMQQRLTYLVSLSVVLIAKERNAGVSARGVTGI